MKILLDENFPLPLYHRLKAAAHEVEHIIVLGQRGVPDSAIRQGVVISRVSQSLPIQRRVEIWFYALQEFIETPPKEKLFDLLDTGDIVPWEIREL